MTRDSPQPQVSPVEDSAPDPASLIDNTGTNATITHYGAGLEAGDDTDFEDDGFDNSTLQSSTTSITSSIMAHVWENGRRYNKFRQGQYVLPNDENEQNREDMKHAMTLQLCDGILHYAPIGDYPQNIIECATCS